jgi:hypothetical protein
MNDRQEQVRGALACNRDVPNDKPSAKQDCSDVVNVSVFFDGTGNNMEVDNTDHKWSNVARMWLAAFQRKDKSTYPIYISGVGTPYNGKAANWLDKAVIATEDYATGGGAGAGGTRRTELGQQNVNDALRKVLIANAQQLGGTAKAYAEKSKGQSFSELAKALKAHRLIKVINLSIFGFSRGAALARAFSNDFLKQCKKRADGELYYGEPGYKVRIHFVGLFDTVASFGVPAGNVDNPWDERNLVLPECVERCVHLVAGHELRFSFPVDLIRQKGKLKAGWREEAFPGVHSDVGGGYLPVAQGIENNYARIPMREMMREAVVQGVRMLGYADLEGDPQLKALFNERFAIADKTQTDYNGYKASVGASGSMEEQVTAHMKALYSAYGTMHRKGIETPYERQTRGSFKQLGGISMAAEVARYRSVLPIGHLGAVYSVLPAVNFTSGAYAQVVQPDAWRLAAWDSTADDKVLEFIKNHVHDSKVDFVMNLEPSSYLRPRGMAESSRNVLATGLQWLDDQVDGAKKGVIKVYARGEAVVVETWEQGVKVATHTYGVGERIVLDALHAGERYAVEVAQTAKDVTISVVETGQKIIVESTEAVGNAAKSAGRKASEVADRAWSGAQEAVEVLDKAVDGGAKAVEAAWKATKARLGLD